jgi:Zn-dependent protease
MDQRENGSAAAADRPRPQRGPERRPGLKVARIFGFPVYLSPSWLIFAVLVTVVYGEQAALDGPFGRVAGYALGAGFVVSLVVSVLLHELGHALASRRLGTGVRGITLELLGGYTELAREAPQPRVEALVSLAGPLASFAVAAGAGAAAYALPDGTAAAHFVVQVAVSNGVIAVFNTLPGLPLDGGRALAALIWAASGDPHRARRIAGAAGQALAALCVAGAVALFGAGWLSLIGLLFTIVMAGSIWHGASVAVNQGRAGAWLHLVDVDRLARPVFRVPSGTALGEAMRRAADAGLAHAALVVVDTDDRARGVVHDAAAAAVPPERWPWVAVDTVARQVDPTRAVPAGARGREVLRAVEADPVGEYLVTSGEDVVGILRVSDLDRIAESPRSTR